MTAIGQDREPGAEASSQSRRRDVPWRGLAAVSGFALAPFVVFLATNRHEGLPFIQVAPYAAIVTVVSLLALIACWAVAGTELAERVGVGIAAVLLMLFNYPAISAGFATLGLRVRYQLLGWAVVAIGIVIACWMASKRPPFRDWTATAAVLLLIVPLGQVVLHRLAASDPMQSEGSTQSLGLRQTPDIYYVVVDAYARDDLLKSSFGYDNSGFTRTLESRGFVVAKDAYSNYTNTYLSVPSTLEMEYVVEAGPQALVLHPDGHRFDRTEFYETIRGDSALMAVLRESGYVHVHAPPGTWSGSECSGEEDLCVEPISRSGAGMVLGELEWALLQLTPAATFLESIGETFDDVTSDPVHTLDMIDREGYSAPVFAFIHMLHAHPPFRFDSRCAVIDPGGRALGNWHEEARDAYVDGIECTNQRLVAMLDRMPPDAVVIIQGDHGPNFHRGTTTPVRDWSAEQIEERLSILQAIRLPEDCRASVPSDLTSVNSFRVVLACLAGEEPDLLPNRHFVAPDRGEPEVREVVPPGRP